MIEQIKQLAHSKIQKIGLGVSLREREYISRTIDAAESAAEHQLGKIILVGDKNQIDAYGISSNLEIIHSLEPEEMLIELLRTNSVAGIVRGSISSSKFLRAVKDLFHVSNVFRIALLETASGFLFFFAPIGIDEGATIAEKVTLVQAGLSLLEILGMASEPIGIISGGRLGDIGRNNHVDKTIAEAEELISILKAQHVTNDVRHYEILIENAIEAKCRIIIAPDGISGNLIYRTLVHLGNGRSHGAWYYNLPYPIIDTSRVAPTFEYESAIAFASALASKKI
ncbi:MAG: methanogenesis marker protein Mmp4/MtxX [Candidatus Helarchaeota archaeon]